jgi:hypothetical protein
MKLIIAAFIVAATLAPSSARAQQPAQQAAAAASEPYVPKIGEIMALQQMRHIKLWFAGRAANWPLADYEIGELKEGFDDVNRQLGGDTVEKAVGAQISALEKVVGAKDRAAFGDAYDNLTAGCNGCHRTLDHPFIVIQRPSSQPYGDQSFAAQK